MERWLSASELEAMARVWQLDRFSMPSMLAIGAFCLLQSLIYCAFHHAQSGKGGKGETASFEAIEAARCGVVTQPASWVWRRIWLAASPMGK